MSITSKFLPLHLSLPNPYPNPNPKFSFPRPLSHPRPLRNTIRCAKKRQRTGNLRYPSEKKKLKSKQKAQVDEADKFEGFWRLYKLGVPVSRDPGKDFLGVSDALLEQIAKALKFPLPGFISSNALLHGVETRTSSPVKIPCSAETYECTSLKGLYPIGEGAVCMGLAYGSHRILPASPTFGSLFLRKKLITCSSSRGNLKYDGDQNGYAVHYKENMRRTFLLLLVSSGFFPTLPTSGKTKNKNPYDERRLLEQNKRVQRENNAPEDFPSFVREGFQVNVVASEYYVKRDSGLIYRDYEVGKGDCPKDGQQVTFHYVGYNESGRRIDSTYLQGSPAKIRMGTKGLVPGFEEGILDMRPGGKRRIIIPPELGPPVGPSTFFSAKQFEVFDVELLSIQNCERRTIVGFYSDVICS